MDSLLELLKVYKDYGVAGLFMVLFVATIYFFYKDLKERLKEQVAITERVVNVLDKASNSMSTSAEKLGGVEESINNQSTQTKEFIAFLRGRDEGRKA